MRQRVFLKLLLLVLVVIAVTTATLELLVRRSWEGSVFAQLDQELKNKVQLFATRADRKTGRISLEQLADEVATATRVRATSIDRRCI